MTEDNFRQPLSVLPIAQSINTGNVLSNQSASKCQKRLHENANSETRVEECRRLTPTKTATTTAVNGRRSVKRVKADPILKDTENLRASEKECELKLKAWVNAYKKQFPTLHFYFDACPEDEVRRCTRKITSLGGTVDPFFSNHVSIVVTTRDITKFQQAPNSHTSDVDPSKQSALRAASMRAPVVVKPAHTTEYGINVHAEPYAHDVLLKAQALGMRVWSLKKLRDSILKNLITTPVTQNYQRSLSNSLRTEKHFGFGEENLVACRGPYILVRDMNEEYRPIMCREWTNVNNPKDGDWPQWRATRPGRCPFVRDKTAELSKEERKLPQVRSERSLHLGTLQHANASGIQQITSAIQSNAGRTAWAGKENAGIHVANLHKKAVTAKRHSKVNAQIDVTETKKAVIEMKPGYCENCREKFDDFNAHLTTRVHRNYAKDESNFVELDSLLAELVRTPLVDIALP